MEVHSKTGLSNVLAGSLTSGEAILYRESRWLPWTFCRGSASADAFPRSGSAAFDELLGRRLRYDIVLIDSPPALLVTDAIAISAKTDAVIWVARPGVVAGPQLARAAELIARNGVPMIGFVVKRMDSRSADYGYEYYGRYYGEKEAYEI